MDIFSRIRDQYDEFNKAQHRIADYILQHPEICGFASLRQFAAATDTTAATVLNFSRKLGFDWEKEEAMGKVEEELLEVKEALAHESQERIQEEFGDLLLSTVNAARLAGVDAELALTRACEKYLSRFASVEEQCTKHGKKVAETSREDLLSYWKIAKNTVD